LYTPGNILQLVENSENGEITGRFIKRDDLQHLVLDGLTPFADHNPMRVKRMVHGQMLPIYYIPVLRDFRLVRQFFEHWY
jgi:hypothetical protein